VFGVDETSRSLDQGILPTVGRQTAKDWAEAIIPKLLSPPVTTCQAGFIEKASHHKNGRGALVISIPLSPQRPHWEVTSAGDVAYIRAGAHSAPMRFQTFQDIMSRGVAPQGEIVDMGVQGDPEHVPITSQRLTYVNPRVRLTSGPICRHWAFEFRIENENVSFESPTGGPFPTGEYSPEPGRFCIEGAFPLFPGRITSVSRLGIRLRTAAFGFPVSAALYLESARPIEKRWEWPHWTRQG
jgi:hypothetical protein